MTAPSSCRACRTPIPPGGHAANGHACVLIQMAALKAQIVADAAVARAADAYLVAHAALADAGTTPGRPLAARAVADIWLALTRAVAARREALAQ